MKKIKSVCVYCASSSKINPRYFEAARETGRLLAQNGMRCVCGAGNQGLMGTLADSVLENGGEVLGVIPRFMIDEGWCHKGLTETIVTADMHERKERMAQEADAVIALPGGCGNDGRALRDNHMETTRTVSQPHRHIEHRRIL